MKKIINLTLVTIFFLSISAIAGTNLNFYSTTDKKPIVLEKDSSCKLETKFHGRYFRRCPTGAFVVEVDVYDHGTVTPTVYVVCHSYMLVCEEPEEN